MSFAAEDKALVKHFKDGWAPHVGTYPAGYENDHYTGPKPPEPWVRFTVLRGNSEQGDIGTDNPLQFYAGVIVVQCFAPVGRGARVLLTIADLVAGLFRGKTLLTESGGKIVCFTPKVLSVRDAKEGWHQKNVAVPYRRDEFQPHAA